MIDPNFWWLTPLLLALLIGLICPTTGSLLITQRRILLANLMAHSVLPGLVLALAFELDPTIGGLISGLIGALLAEKLNQQFKGREEAAMNTVLAGFTALGVLLVPLLQARVDLETILRRPAGRQQRRSHPHCIATAALSVLLLSRYEDLVFIGIDPDGAIAAKRPVNQIRFLAILITALVVISAITAVGIVLVIALLCAPVLVHIEASNSLRSLMLRSAATGLLLCGSGMTIAMVADLPPGPLIGVLCVVLLLAKSTASRWNPSN